MIMDKEDGSVFTEAMELHVIDMKAFAKAINEADSINIEEAKEDMFAYWLSVITEKEILNKDIIENARKEKEVIQMAVSAIARQSQDKETRRAYQRRQDNIYFYNMERVNDRRIAEEYRQQAEKDRQRTEKAEAEIEQLRQQIAAMQANRN